jgi:purine nucleosidase
MNTPIPIVLDTDIGSDVDDALALLLALASPEVDLLGVTIVDGDVDLRARIAARLLGMAGRSDIPIFKGRSDPLGPGRMPSMHGHEGRGLLDLPYDGPEATIDDLPAEAWLVEHSRKEPFHLVAIGPYTNVATAIESDPTIVHRLLHVTAMGGMVYYNGYAKEWRRFLAQNSIDPASPDHNTASDPTAALILARSGIPITWIPIEVTLKAPLGRQVLQILQEIGTPLSKSLRKLLLIWHERWQQLFDQNHHPPFPCPGTTLAYLHDPLALASLFPGPWLEIKPEKLRFSIEEALFHIHVVDRGQEAIHNVAIAVQSAEFESFFLDRIISFMRRQEK